MIIPVNLGSRSYRIIVESGALDTVGARLAELRVGSRTALVSDAAILRLYGKAVARSLESAGFTVTTVEVPAGEAAKTLGVAERCWDALLAAGLDRTSTVLALGGGAGGGRERGVGGKRGDLGGGRVLKKKKERRAEDPRPHEDERAIGLRHHRGPQQTRARTIYP